MRAPPPDTSTLAVRFQVNLEVGGINIHSVTVTRSQLPDSGWDILGAVLSNTASLRGPVRGVLRTTHPTTRQSDRLASQCPWILDWILSGLGGGSCNARLLWEVLH